MRMRMCGEQATYHVSKRNATKTVCAILTGLAKRATQLDGSLSGLQLAGGLVGVLKPRKHKDISKREGSKPHGRMCDPAENNNKKQITAYRKLLGVLSLSISFSLAANHG